MDISSSKYQILATPLLDRWTSIVHLALSIILSTTWSEKQLSFKQDTYKIDYSGTLIHVSCGAGNIIGIKHEEQNYAEGETKEYNDITSVPYYSMFWQTKLVYQYILAYGT